MQTQILINSLDGIKLLLSSLQPFHYSHVQLIYARINGFIIHTITQPLHRDRNILPSFQPQQRSLSSTLPYDIYYNMRFRKWHWKVFPMSASLSVKWSQWLKGIKTGCNRLHWRWRTEDQKRRVTSLSSHLLCGHKMTATITSQQPVCSWAKHEKNDPNSHCGN